MNKFFEIIGSLLLIGLFIVLVGVVIKNNVPAVNDWVNGWGQQQEQVTPTPDEQEPETPTEDEQEPEVPETPAEGEEDPEVTVTPTFKFGNNLVNIYVAA